jgi:hypothetical protein
MTWVFLHTTIKLYFCYRPKTIKVVFVASPLSKDWLAWNQDNVSK